MLFQEIAIAFEKTKKTASRLEITTILAELFKKTSSNEIKKLCYLLQGTVQPSFTGIEIGMGDKLAEKSISLTTGETIKQIEENYKKTGDLSATTKSLMEKRKQSSLASEELTLEKVFDNLYKISTTSGSGSVEMKIKLLSELLSNAKPEESEIIMKIITGKISSGFAEQTIISALNESKEGSKENQTELERAYYLTSDLGEVAETLLKKGFQEIKKIKPSPFKPIMPALAERLTNAGEIIKKLGECVADYKYDGFRLQVHMKNKEIQIYSRRQEKMTHMFPDLIEAVKKQIKAEEIIFEGEAISFNEKNQTFLPFQVTITRKRKHEVEKTSKSIPLRLYAFDLLYLNGEDYTQKPYMERRKKLEETIKQGDKIYSSTQKTVKTAEELNEYFNEALKKGLEGVIAKDLNAPYTVGARKFAWIKLKKSYESKIADTIDAAIIGYYYGKGKRTKLGAGGLLTAIYDDKNDKFKTIAKLGTGFSEEQLEWFSKNLKPVKEKPINVESILKPQVWVEPLIVVTIKADEITQSTTHTCAFKDGQGLALRFPRLTQIRTDKKPTDATTEREVVEMFRMQSEK